MVAVEPFKASSSRAMSTSSTSDETFEDLCTQQAAYRSIAHWQALFTSKQIAIRFAFWLIRGCLPQQGPESIPKSWFASRLCQRIGL